MRRTVIAETADGTMEVDLLRDRAGESEHTARISHARHRPTTSLPAPLARRGHPRFATLRGCLASMPTIPNRLCGLDVSPPGRRGATTARQSRIDRRLTVRALLYPAVVDPWERS